MAFDCSRIVFGIVTMYLVFFVKHNASSWRTLDIYSPHHIEYQIIHVIFYLLLFHKLVDVKF